MSDRYLDWVNTRWGGALSRMLRLPTPVPLERHRHHRPVTEGDVLIGAHSADGLVSELVSAAKTLGLSTLAHPDAPYWTAQANRAGLMSGPWRVAGAGAGRLKAMILDASTLSRARDTERLHRFLHESLPALQTCGRVVLLGRSPESCTQAEHASLQRALEGLMRSIGRELRRGATAHLVSISPGAEGGLTGALSFLLSPRSAYVSGQVIRLSEPAIAGAGEGIDPERPLAGRTLLVTGASQGIGEAIARTLARDGAAVVALDIPQRESALRALAGQIGGRMLAVDLTAEGAVSAIVEAARADGGWEGVIHNAGITRDRTIVKMPRDRWEAVLAVNLIAPLALDDALARGGLLKPGARVVAVSSIAGIAGNRGQTNYAFSKAGVIGWVEASAAAYAARGMAINAVAPGFIESAMTASMPFAVREAGRRLNALSQGGQAVDVAEAVAWLASPAAAAVNGQVLRVCGQSLIGA